MTRVRFIGDIHGDFDTYRKIINDAEKSVQVGDYGVGFPGYTAPKDISMDHRYIRGNHDNPEACRSDPRWIQDGTVEKTKYGPIMYIGGAWSIDKDSRTPGINWWFDEELSYSEMEVIAVKYAEIRPSILCTHDIPYSINRKLFDNGMDIKTKTAMFFDDLYKIHKPGLNLFGHWHLQRNEVIDGTQFVCLPEFGYVDIDL
jgi:predicted phosphodiesterase